MAGSKSASKPSGTTVKAVYDSLRAPIVDGQIPPGERINIDATAQWLGVSHTPVREALQKLVGDDLVVYTAGRGYRTTPILDLPGLRSVFEFRLLIEPWAARAAATHRLSNPAAALQAELASFADLAGSREDVRQEMLGHDSRFHATILASTGNDVVRSAFAQAHCHLHVFRLYSVDLNGRETLPEHQRIIDAVRDCDPDAAERAMTEHISNSYDRSSRAFKGSQPELRIGPAAADINGRTS